MYEKKIFGLVWGRPAVLKKFCNSVFLLLRVGFIAYMAKKYKIKDFLYTVVSALKS